MDTSDASAARSFLAGQARRAGAHATSYRGVSYEVTAAGIAFGLVDRFAVIGSEAGLRGVIDTTQGEAALSAAGGYSKLLGAAPSEAIGHLYVNPTSAQHTSSAATGLPALLSGGRQANVSLVASAGSLSLDLDTLAAAGTNAAGCSRPTRRPRRRSAGCPGESWLAIGLGDDRREAARRRRRTACPGLADGGRLERPRRAPSASARWSTA